MAQPATKRPSILRDHDGKKILTPDVNAFEVTLRANPNYPYYGGSESIHLMRAIKFFKNNPSYQYCVSVISHKSLKRSPHLVLAGNVEDPPSHRWNSYMYSTVSGPGSHVLIHCRDYYDYRDGVNLTREPNSIIVPATLLAPNVGIQRIEALLDDPDFAEAWAEVRILLWECNIGRKTALFA